MLELRWLPGVLRRRQIDLLKVRVHLCTCRILIDLHEHLPDHFPLQTLTNLCQIAGRPTCACLTVKADIMTDARICVHR
jgi:hypothetical protein